MEHKERKTKRRTEGINLVLYTIPLSKAPPPDPMTQAYPPTIGEITYN